MNKNYAYKLIIFAFTYGISFYYLKTFSKQNSWLIVIIGSIIGLAYIKMISKIKNSCQNKTIYEINKIVLGNTIGSFVNILFSLVFALLSTILLWYLSIYLKTNFFDETPTIIINIILMLPIIYAINKNELCFSKSNVIFSYIVYFLTIISFIFLLPQVELSNFKPFNEIRMNGMINALFGFTTTAFLPTYAINGKKLLNLKESVKIIALIIGIVFFTYAVLGNSLVEMVDFPEFFVLRKIGLNANGTRIDGLLIIGWFLSTYVTNMTFILFIKDFFEYEFKPYKNNYSYLIVIIILTFSLFIFKNITVGKLFILKILPTILFLTLFFLNFIIFCIIKVKHKNVSHEY